MMWAAGAVAAMSSITFPAVSALVSRTADPDQQGETLALRCGDQNKTLFFLFLFLNTAFYVSRCEDCLKPYNFTTNSDHLNGFKLFVIGQCGVFTLQFLLNALLL